MASHADADLILRLYDLRREPVMREGRAWLLSWWPVDATEAKAVASDFSLRQNAWLRQVTSYWEMAFSLAHAGTIDADLFAKNSGEGILFALKCQALGKAFPEAFPRRMPDAEAWLAQSAISQQKAEMFRKRFGW